MLITLICMGFVLFYFVFPETQALKSAHCAVEKRDLNQMKVLALFKK